jgi:hypothetical protein
MWCREYIASHERINVTPCIFRVKRTITRVVISPFEMPFLRSTHKTRSCKSTLQYKKWTSMNMITSSMRACIVVDNHNGRTD